MLDRPSLITLVVLSACAETADAPQIRPDPIARASPEPAPIVRETSRPIEAPIAEPPVIEPARPAGEWTPPVLAQPLPIAELDALVRAHESERLGLDGWRVELTTRYAPLAEDRAVALALVAARDPQSARAVPCGEDALDLAAASVQLLERKTDGWMIVRERALDTESSSEGVCTMAGELEVGDWNRNAVPEARVLLSFDERDYYYELDRRRLFLVELDEALPIVLDDDAGLGTFVTTPGCYEGEEEDVEDVFSVERNDRVTYEWSDPGAPAPYELKRRLESTLRRCAQSVDPIHRRGPEGSCIQEQSLAWSPARGTWITYRGFAPRAHTLVVATAPRGDRLAARLPALSLPAGVTASVHPSDELSGLRPGRFVIVLGACDRREPLDAIRDRLDPPLRRESYVRPLSALPPSIGCP